MNHNDLAAFTITASLANHHLFALSFVLPFGPARAEARGMGQRSLNQFGRRLTQGVSSGVSRS
jgi:hypothetical protein